METNRTRTRRKEPLEGLLVGGSCEVILEPVFGMTIFYFSLIEPRAGTLQIFSGNFSKTKKSQKYQNDHRTIVPAFFGFFFFFGSSRANARVPSVRFGSASGVPKNRSVRRHHRIRDHCPHDISAYWTSDSIFRTRRRKFFVSACYTLFSPWFRLGPGT